MNIDKNMDAEVLEIVVAKTIIKNEPAAKIGHGAKGSYLRLLLQYTLRNG